MGWFSGKPRLRDITELQPMLPATRHIVFFLPHTSEHPTTLPLLSELSEAIRKKGIVSETHSVEEMKSAVISLSLRLSRLRFSKHEKGMLDGLYRLRDACNRLAIVASILTKDAGSLLVEVQALGKDYHEGDCFPCAAAFNRLPESRVLFLKDYYGDFLAQVRKGLRIMDAASSPNLIAAASLLRLDSATIDIETRLGLKVLMDNASRCLMLCIPAEKARGFDDLDIATDFERDYGFGMSMGHTLEKRDVQKIIELLA